MTVESERIDYQAAEWAVRLSQGALDPAQSAEFDVWLAANVRHRGALVRAQAAWMGVDRIAALSGSSSQHRALKGSHQGSADYPRATQMGRRWFLAAGLSTLSIGLGLEGWRVWRRRGEVFESEIGEIRRLSLSDGSTMLLDSGTRVEVHLNDQRRQVTLVRGQGLFEVTKDVVRPFVVLTRDVSVRAVGTVFSVRSVDPDVAVMVTEGAVDVGELEASNSLRQRVATHQQAVITANRGINVTTITEAQANRQLSWRDGILSFDGESLAQAVAEINRHNVRHIAIDDPILGARPIVGIFKSVDVEGFAQTVAAALGAQSIVDSAEIHLRSGPRGSPSR